MSVIDLTISLLNLLIQNDYDELSSYLPPHFCYSLAITSNNNNNKNILDWFIQTNSTSQVAQDLIKRYILHITNLSTVQSTTSSYRRISRNRLQACCKFTLSDNDEVSFIWESGSICKEFNDWRFRRIRLVDNDDEEYYWRPWHSSLELAENDYESANARNWSSDSELLYQIKGLHLKAINSLNSSAMSSPALSTSLTLSSTLSSTTSSFDEVALHQNTVKEMTNDEDEYWNRYEELDEY